MRRIAVISLMALGLVVGSGSAAFAGETTGNGQPSPSQGKSASLCSYSGQDVPDSVENNEPEFDDDWNTNPGKKETAVPSGTLVQNYGQIVAAGGKGASPSPSDLCRGNLFR